MEGICGGGFGSLFDLGPCRLMAVVVAGLVAIVGVGGGHVWWSLQW